MTDKEENISITEQLNNLKNKLEEEFNNEYLKIQSLNIYLDKLSLEFNQLNLNFYEKELKKHDSNNTMDNFLDTFYLFQNKLFGRIKSISEMVSKDISPSLKRAKKIYEKENKKYISALEDIINQINQHQTVMNIIKTEYYDECQKLESMEQDNKKENSTSNNDNNEVMQKMANQTKSMENKFSLYKKEVDVMKKLCSDCERDFENIKQKLRDNEIKKNNNIYSILSNYLLYFSTDTKIITDDENIFQEYIDQIKSKINNSQLIDNISGQNILWKYDFDITRSNNKNKNNEKEELNEINIKEVEEENEMMNHPVKFDELIIMPNKEHEIEGIDLNYMELNKINYELIKKEEDESTKKFSSELLMIKDFFKMLLTTDIIQSEQKNTIMNILEKYQGNVNCYIKFCDKFLFSNRESKEELFEFQSFSNLAYFSGLLKNIIENISDNLLSNDINSYKLFDKIICIGEKSMYKDTYLCELLSTENQIFKKDIIWENCIKNKLINLFNDICKKEIKQEKSKQGYIRKSIGAIGKLFHKKDSKTKGKKSLIELYNLDKHIKIFKNLDKIALKKISETYGQNVLHELIKCYIRHMINYNFLNKSEKTKTEIENIFNKILTDYSIKDDNRITFLNLYFFSNIHSTKKPKENSKNKLQNNATIFYTSQPDEKNIFIFKLCSKYLNAKEKINLLNLNKQYMNLNKYIYYQYLKTDTNFNSKNRIGIWKILLKYKESLKKYDYKKIIEELNKIPITEKEGNGFIIMLDIQRTKFKMKEKDGQTILCNLLRSLFYDNDKELIIYCQGMNYIAAIFYDIIQNEEETFHLLKSFFVNGKYEIIFKNRLSILKEYFIILDKLIYLYLPKIHEKLMANKIQANLFVSPYFVTLFTNIYSYHQDNANKFLLHCIDDFILNGWCSLFSTLICVLKYLEKKIFELKPEELIKFLVNDIGKNELFIDDNFEIFYKLKKQYWITNDLLDKLYEEIKLEKEIKSQFSETEQNE